MSAPDLSRSVVASLSRAQAELQRAVDVALAGDAQALRDRVIDAEAALGALRHQLDRALAAGGPA